MPAGRPTFQTKALGRRLRELRKEVGLSAAFVANADDLDVSEQTIHRWETGGRPKPRDVAALCHIYGADEQLTDELVQLARRANEPGWWRSYDGGVPEWFDTYVSAEKEAIGIRAYEADFVYGLFQTSRYADALIRSKAPAPSDGSWPTDEVCRQRVAVRLERQRVLGRGRPPQLDVVLGEAALMRSPGNGIMAEQLEHLDALSRKPHVTIRVVPIGEIHPGLNCGARFQMLGFPPTVRGATEPPMVFADNLTGAAYLTKPSEVKAYEAVWEGIMRVALSPADSRKMIRTCIERYRNG